jgi:hypothetical protein
MVPAGAGVPVCPTATTFKVIDPPRVGVLAVDKVSVGVNVETCSETVLEVTPV